MKRMHAQNQAQNPGGRKFLEVWGPFLNLQAWFQVQDMNIGMG